MPERVRAGRTARISSALLAVEALAGDPLHRLVQPAVVVGDALEHGPHDVALRRADRQVVEPAARVAVVDGGALTLQPRREDDATTAGRRVGGDFGELAEREAG